MNKRGQFYLIAAIVVIAIIIGFATISNYYKEKSSTKIYDLGEEIGIESSEVLDYGTINDDVDYEELIGHFTGIYSKYAGEDKEIYFIFGNKENIVAYTYESVVSGSIALPFPGGGSPGLTLKNRIKKDLPINKEESKILIKIKDDISQEFELKPGENFYYVIFQKIGEEQHIVVNKNE